MEESDDAFDLPTYLAFEDEAEAEAWFRERCKLYGIDPTEFDCLDDDDGPDDEPPPGWQVMSRTRVSLAQRRSNPYHPLYLFEGRYRMLREIGEGSMGAVYQAEDTQLGRSVAIKFLASDMIPERGLPTEASLLAKIDHPNVVEVHDAGCCEDGPYVVMAFVKGRSLAAWLPAAERSWLEILSVYLAAGRGLVAIHAAGIEHHDFKHDNVLIDDEGHVRVVDFGLARLVGQEARLRKGTCPYAAPEALDRKSDLRSDQFSFCATLWHALFHCMPYAGKTAEELRQSYAAGHLRIEMRWPDMPPTLEEILRVGLSVDPAERHESMAVLVRKLEDVLLGERTAGEPVQRRPWDVTFAVVSVGLVVACAVLVVVAWRELERERSEAWLRLSNQVRVALACIEAEVAAQVGQPARALGALQSAYDHGSSRDDVSGLAKTATEVALALDSYGQHDDADVAWMFAEFLHHQDGNEAMNRVARAALFANPPRAIRSR
ncbi:MAG: serine/threonine protein kinase [Deltaproteobacteria bacterium]|nr:serine/threonine protein kinase [Deltaproteobacteria bacterium]